MFDKVVFASGGHRCWWQAGFWEQVSGEIELHPRVIGAVSTGAFTACLLYANDTRRALAWYERELKGLRSNVNLFNLVRRGKRLMPHAAIYRKALRALLGGENFRQLMWRAPELRVQCSRLPPGISPARALLSATTAYGIDRYWRGAAHPVFGEHLGITHEVKRVQDCRSERELVDLLVASSCATTFASAEGADDQPCLDTGLVDNVPTGTVADVPGQTLVLTTSRHRSNAPVFAHNGLVYVQPSEKIPVAAWDCTSPARFQKTYDLGRRDGEQFLRTFALGQHRGSGLDAGSLAAGFPAVGAEAKVSEPGHAGGADDSGGALGLRGADNHRGAANHRGAGDSRDADGPRDPVRAAEAKAVHEGPDDAAAADEEADNVLDVNAKLANYREPTEAGIAEDLSATQPAASEGHERSGRSLRASNI